MQAEIDESEDLSVSLYFRLRDGQNADLEVAASTAIAWVRAMRAAAHAVDPETEFRVELVDADEGSLLVNAILKWTRDNIDPQVKRVGRGYKRLPRAAQLALALAPFLIFTAGPTYDTYFGDPDYSEADRAEMHRILTMVQADHEFLKHLKQLYRQADKDPAIAGIGLTKNGEKKPIAEVPARNFAEAGGLWSELDADVQERWTTTVLEVILVKPALVGEPRSWTFEQVGLPSFDAVMRDAHVLAAMRSNGLPERLREGIPMKIKLEIHETAIDGQWRVARGGRSVTQVLSPKLD